MRGSGTCLAIALTVCCSSTRTRLPDSVLPHPETGDIASATDGGADAGPTPVAACKAPGWTGEKPWYVDAVFYEIFVRSFQDSDGDGIGDLKGLTSRLPYLEDMGITALWLMPINTSPSYHGYDVTDYRAIDPHYGTLDDFDALLKEADARGIRVVMDLVVNHSSRQHPWFVTGKRGPGNDHHDWYVWANEAPTGWRQPWSGTGTVWHAAGPRWFYGVFWDGMPDLNFKTPAVADEMRDIATFWVQRGVSGFRLDAARYLVENGPATAQSDQPETHAFWRSLRSAVVATDPEAFLVGEVWTDFTTTATYFGAAPGDELHMVFGFDRAAAIRTGLRLGNATPVASKLCAELKGVPPYGQMGSFLTNHDLDRLASDVSDPEALKLSVTLLMTMPGTPFLYYGEELGLANGPGGGDEPKRLPMRWDETAHFGFSVEAPWQPDAGSPAVEPVSVQAANDSSLLSHTKSMIALRRQRAALTGGGTERLTPAGSGGSLLAYVRTAGTQHVVVVANLGKTEATDVTVEVGGQTITVGALAPYGAHVQTL